jgi:hypothetical protein
MDYPKGHYFILAGYANPGELAHFAETAGCKGIRPMKVKEELE